ncbi:MAG: hypothetical protein R2758_10000 [Bacteroidales bacterium]
MDGTFAIPDVRAGNTAFSPFSVTPLVEIVVSNDNYLNVKLAPESLE